MPSPSRNRSLLLWVDHYIDRINKNAVDYRHTDISKISIMFNEWAYGVEGNIYVRGQWVLLENKYGKKQWVYAFCIADISINIHYRRQGLFKAIADKVISGCSVPTFIENVLNSDLAKWLSDNNWVAKSDVEQVAGFDKVASWYVPNYKEKLYIGEAFESCPNLGS